MVRIEVPNTKVAQDLILSYNKQKINFECHDTKYLLKMFKCRRFFCLENDVKLLYDTKVSPNDFHLFMEVVDEFDFINDKHLMQTIKKNIPLDYDLNKFSLEFINELQFNDYLIIAGSGDHRIKVWDAYTGQLLNTLVDHTSDVRSVALSSDNLRIASHGLDHNISIWDAQTGKLLNTWNSHTKMILSVAFSPDNLKIASGSCDNCIKIWNAQSGQLLNVLNGHTSSVFSVVFSTDNLRIASGSLDHSIKIWDAHSGQLLNTLNGLNMKHSVDCREATSHTNWVRSVAFSPDNLKIVSGSDDASIKIWDAYTGQLLDTLIDPSLGSPKSHTRWIRNVAFSPDNLKIISGSDDYNIKIWDAHSGSLLNTLTDDTNIILCVTFSPDGLKIASGSCDKIIKIWDAQTGQLLNTLIGHTDWIYSVAFSNLIIHPIDVKLKNYINNLKQ
jgi:WD40 repeat protein